MQRRAPTSYKFLRLNRPGLATQHTNYCRPSGPSLSLHRPPCHGLCCRVCVCRSRQPGRDPQLQRPRWRPQWPKPYQVVVGGGQEEVGQRLQLSIGGWRQSQAARWKGFAWTLTLSGFWFWFWFLIAGDSSSNSQLPKLSVCADAQKVSHFC